MSDNLFGIEGKTAVVTGASSGIGKSIAGLFLNRGVNVAALARRKERLNEIGSMLRSADGGGGKLLPIVCDVKDENEVISSVDTVVKEFGRIDILVNCAGVTAKSENITTHTTEQWDNVIDTNLKGAYMVSREVAKDMIKNGYGKIINISSMAALMGLSNQVSYVSAKSGIIGLTRAMSVELGKYGITVNAILPGYTQSEMTNIGSSGYRYFKDRSVLNDIATPEDIHGAVLLLASDASRFITGSFITIDGGVTSNL